jgi:hypothetical protein
METHINKEGWHLINASRSITQQHKTIVQQDARQQQEWVQGYDVGSLQAIEQILR